MKTQNKVLGFVSHEAPTPLVSSSEEPTKKSRPPSVSPEAPALPLSPDGKAEATPDYKTLNEGPNIRKPRFSSPSTPPLVIQRPIKDFQTPNGTTLSPSLSNDFHHERKRSKRRQQPMLDSSRGLAIYDVDPLVPTDTDFVVPFLIACDFFKTKIPLQLIQGALRKLLLSLLSRSSPPSALPILVQPQTGSGLSEPVDLPNDVRNICGIPNYGQSCFLNSVLQSLASLEPFIVYLKRIAKIQHGTSNLSNSASWFVKDVLELLFEVNGTRPVSRIDPRPLLKRIGEANSQFRNHTGEQQDAQELLQTLLEVVISDAKLDSLSSVCDNVHFPEHDSCAKTNDEQLTSVMARDCGRNLQPELNGIHAAGIQNGDGLLSLSFMLECIAEGQDSFRNQNDSPKSKAANKSQEGCSYQREEKKQEDFELPGVTSPGDKGLVDAPSCEISVKEENSHLTKRSSSDSFVPDRKDSRSVNQEVSTSLKILKSTISSVTPSPLSGWLGSALRCCNCKRVRPIQNAAFFDIPLTPTSVSRWLTQAHRPNKTMPAPNVASMPSCSLDQCLSDFTSVERVPDVECHSCTIQKEIDHWEEEVMLLRMAISSTEKRTLQKGEDPRESVKYLQADLSDAEARLDNLRSVDPDSGEIPDEYLKHNIGFDSDEVSTQIPKKALERCDANKCLLLTRTPSVLCCHIQRRYYDHSTDRMEKCVQHVEFPLIFDLSPYCAYGPRATTPWAAGSSKETLNKANAKGRIPYRLQSIIEHRGNAHGGHYITYRRNSEGQWFRISDDKVMPLPWDQVRNCQAYMLFYEAM